MSRFIKKNIHHNHVTTIYGATTLSRLILSIMTFRIMTLGITKIKHEAHQMTLSIMVEC
jgi:hypothetical protein